MQFYFTNQTQQDVIAELTELSSTIREAADVHIIREFGVDSLLEDDFTYLGKNDKKNTYDKTKYQYLWKTLNGPRPDLSNEDRNIDLHIEHITPKDSKTGIIHERIIRRPVRKTRFKLSSPDSLFSDFEEIEVHLNPQKKQQTGLPGGNRFFPIPKVEKGKTPSFSFVIPDFTAPENPRLVRYKYETATLNQAMESMRDRNIIISLLLFGVSIIAIMFVTRRFLRPIDSLKQSFDKVVSGELDVQVQTKSNDEIGDLTNSFNSMVAELRKNKEKEHLLQRKERLASLGQLAAGVAHEVKNPLNAINLTIEHLNDKFIDQTNDQATSYISTIQSEIRRLDKLVNNFLNYLRSEELQKTKTDVNAIIMDVLVLYEREIEESDIKVDRKFDKQLIIELDEERVKTAIVNIIVNAIQAMPQGGRLSVQTNAESKTIIINDSGTGIEAIELEHIFDLFYTTKSKGSGLGLPTAYKIIKAHNGEIKITSEKDKGTQVEIIFNGTGRV